MSSFADQLQYLVCMMGCATSSPAFEAPFEVVVCVSLYIHMIAIELRVPTLIKLT